jgi:pimeloyl-ACP methyl ester carboxylesterase
MAIARNGTCELFYESFGDPSDPALLMINGLGSQCINFRVEWIDMFLQRGFRVIRFDNRDVGLSTKFDGAPTGEGGEAYRLSDMAGDAIAVIDANAVDRAHVMGVSMGGMIVQALAIEHRDRLLSMTSIMSTTGEPGYGQAMPEASVQFARKPATDRESFVEGHVAGLRIWGSPEFADEDRWRADANRAFDRCFSPLGTRRQYLGIQASGSRADGLRGVTTPTLVVHGDRDTLIDPSGGRRTADLVPGARFELIEGMGHDYPPQLWHRWVDLIGDFALA